MTWSIAIETLCCACLFLTGCDRASELHYDDPPGQVHTVAYLKSLCPTEGAHVVREQLTLRAAVTANDLFGEFSKTIVAGDESGGIEISIEHDDLSRLFPLGVEVEIRCDGLAVGEYGGKAVLGAPPTSVYSVDRIPATELNRYIRVVDRGNHRRAELRTFADLTIRDAGRYVRFEGVRFTDPNALWCDIDPETQAWTTTERQLADAAGRTLSVRTLAGCSYAAEPLPSGTGSVQGILDYFNGAFSLRITNREFFFPTDGGTFRAGFRTRLHPAAIADRRPSVFAEPPTADPSTAGY